MPRRITVLTYLAVLLAVGWMAPALRAGDSTRAGRSQFSVPINFLAGTTIDGKGGSTVDLNDEVGFGFAGGYNLSEHLYLGGEITWIDVN